MQLVWLKSVHTHGAFALGRKGRWWREDRLKHLTIYKPTYKQRKTISQKLCAFVYWLKSVTPKAINKSRKISCVQTYVSLAELKDYGSKIIALLSQEELQKPIALTHVMETGNLNAWLTGRILYELKLFAYFLHISMFYPRIHYPTTGSLPTFHTQYYYPFLTKKFFFDLF